MEEIWKDIKGYEQLYQISNLGNVRSLNYNHTKQSKIIKPNTNRYLQVTLCQNGRLQYLAIHRLVYETFVGEIPEGMQVNHINEDVKDNRLENLNLMDCKTNINWGTGIKRRSEQISKPILQYDLEDNFIKEWVSASEAARQLGFSQSNISACCLGKRKQANGYKWKYK